MNISIITPIYYGNQYINNYLKAINKACENVKGIEIIFVNDSPEIEIEYDFKLVKNFELRIIENKENMGIHKSRVIGMKHAKGKYLLFLDQDDEVTENALVLQDDIVKKEPDIILGNGLYEMQDSKKNIFSNRFSQDFATKERPFIMVRNFIISPGQCLVKKDSIPRYWMENCLSSNGADDYLLWLLMFNENVQIVCNYNIVYRHKYTGKNLSLDKEKMFCSQLELIDILEKNKLYKKEKLKILKRMIYYKHAYKQNFLIETLKNFDIFVYNLYYKIVWKGYVSKK